MRHGNSVNNLFLNQKVVQVSKNYTVQADDVIIEVGALSAPITITLPTPSPKNVGKFFLIKDSGGTASTYHISITTPATLIDGAKTLALGQNYDSIQVFSDGANYFTSLSFPLKELARGGWEKRASTAFDIAGTVIQTEVSNWDTKPINEGGRLVFTNLTKTTPVTGLKEGTNNITFTQSGVYTIWFLAQIIGKSYSVCQLIKNDTKVLLPSRAEQDLDQDIGSLQIIYTDLFQATDMIDLRFGAFPDLGLYQFYTLDFSIQQLPRSF